jgi:aldehyde dehydrogenase (NAD+)
VQGNVYDKFLDLLIDKVKSTPVGDGFDDGVTNGPIVSGRDPFRNTRWPYAKV